MSAAARAARASQTPTEPPAKVLPATKPSWWLVAIGISLIMLFVAGAVLARVVGNTTEEISAPVTTAVPATGATPAATAAAQEIRTTTTTKNWPSETLLTTVLATGAALVAIGFLYSRLTVIKLPGGAELDLGKAERDAVATKVEEEARGKNVPAEKMAEVKEAAFAIAREKKQAGGLVRLENSDIEAAAREALGSVVSDVAQQGA